MGKQHGLYNTRIHSIWWGMIARCDYPSIRSYKYYGARGITYAPEWRTFMNFYNDMNSSYKEGYSLDRINVNGNYTKENCRWIPLNEQQSTRRTCKMITYKGETLSCAQWGRRMDVHKDTIAYRLNRGWPVDKILSLKPKHSNNPVPKKTDYKCKTQKCELCESPYQAKGLCKLHYYRWYNKHKRKSSKSIL